MAVRIQIGEDPEKRSSKGESEETAPPTQPADNNPSPDPSSEE